MKVLLISANTETSPYPVYPLGLDYVAGAIGSEHEVHLADLHHDSTDSMLKERIKTIDPAIIGISIRNIDNTDHEAPRDYIEQCRHLIRSIRELSPAPVVLGGSGFSLFPTRLLRELGADYGIIGEGERFRDFLKAIEQQQDVTRLEGVVSRNEQNPREPPRPWQGAISRCPVLDSPYVGYYLQHGGMLNLQTKRGCPFKCIYCTYPGIEGNRLRLTPPEAVADTALELQEAGAKYLFITDSVFNSDIQHSLQVARSLRQAGLSIPWGAYIAPRRLPRGYFQELAAAGMSHVEFGTESLSDPVLESYQKPFRCLDVFQAHQAAAQAGLHIAHFFLLGAPAETPQTIEKTMQKASWLPKTVCFFFTGIRLYPQTQLHDLALESAQITKDQDLLRPYFYSPPGIGLEEIQTMLAQGSRKQQNWILGGSGQKMTRIISRLHARGHIGPLWEHLIP